jgi:Uma2 family endonuclease
MNWREIVSDPSLADLPYKIETNESGQVIMSPTVFLHGIYQAELTQRLRQLLPNGITSNETAIETRKGVKVPDLTWFSLEFFQLYRNEFALPAAPEICVEVISKSNSVREINLKRKLYFECGAREVWTCNLEGQMRFYGSTGELERSTLAPKFPNHVELGLPTPERNSKKS